MQISLENTCAVILAAGNGTRMTSGKSKIFCDVLFKPLIGWVVKNCIDAKIKKKCLICSHDNVDKLKKQFDNSVTYVFQEQKLGTAHAAKQASEFLLSSSCNDVLILLGDVPFVEQKIIEESYYKHKLEKNEATVIAANVEVPYGYGRIDEIDGKVNIVEEKDATDFQKTIKKVNSGAMWFKTDSLLNSLDMINNDNASGEYYITTVVNILKKTGCYVAKENNVILGANTTPQLFTLNEVARKRILNTLNLNGVEFLTYDGVLIGPDVIIEPGSTILPNVTIIGNSYISKNCVITSGSFINNSLIENNCEIKNSYIIDSKIGKNVIIGPFAHIRPKSNISNCVKIGNFVEIKNSTLDEHTKVAHLTYIGDSEIGKKVNFGCGCVTANYNGKEKLKTIIKDNSFIGCNSSLVAPITIGKDSFIAAGSVVTDDVPDEQFVIARSKQITKPKK